MNRKLTSRSSLENLKREAKRWLKALRDRNSDAQARLTRALPNPPAPPTLRDVQHALAIEYGYSGWAELTDALASQRAHERTSEQLTAILTAAEKGDVEQLAELLDAHPESIDQRGALRGHDGLRTALHFGNHHYDAVKLLLEHGADPNIRDEGDNAYPLHFVAERLDLPTAQLLIEHGADTVGEGDMHGLGVVGWAACFNPQYLGITSEERIVRRHAMVDYLLAHGGRHNIFSATAMDAADAIRTIVSEQPDQLERPMDDANRRRHPLHLAVVEKRRAALVTLLELGADMDAKDVAGLTPLDQAALIGDRETADLLIARGARLELPAALALDLEVERLLSDNPRAIQPGGHWATLVIRAAEQPGTRMLETLLRHGADVNTTDDDATAVDGTVGYTALHAAAFHGNRAAVELLLAHGASVTARVSRYQGTPAGWAAYAKHDDIAQRILAGPIDMFQAVEYQRAGRLREIFDRDPGSLNARMPRPTAHDSKEPEWATPWWTPLSLAVANGYVDGVRELLALGAESDARDPHGRSLRELAIGGGHTEIAALLAQEERTRTAPTSPGDTETPDQRVARFLANACPDHHVRGGGSHIVARQTAASMLAEHPELARHDIYTAVVCGELAEVERILAADPDAARRKGGPKGSAVAQGEQFVLGATSAAHPRWEPLLYLCFARVDSPKSTDNAVAIARLLLEHGADPNAYFMAGSSRYSPLTGVIGEGEENRPPHPRRDELTKLLL
jgi:ankyrin repeat protein